MSLALHVGEDRCATPPSPLLFLFLSSFILLYIVQFRNIWGVVKEWEAPTGVSTQFASTTSLHLFLQMYSFSLCTRYLYYFPYAILLKKKYTSHFQEQLELLSKIFIHHEKMLYFMQLIIINNLFCTHSSIFRGNEDCHRSCSYPRPLHFNLRRPPPCLVRNSLLHLHLLLSHWESRFLLPILQPLLLRFRQLHRPLRWPLSFLCLWGNEFLPLQ